jgi:hypothetical protein
MRFVLSHPFARKKAKGWGTELVQIHTVRDLDEKLFSAVIASPVPVDMRALRA